MRLQYFNLLIGGILWFAITGCDSLSKKDSPDIKTDETVVAFYYPWYGNPDVDGEYRHWNHQIFGYDNDTLSFSGGDDIGANYYPQLGCYSSNDKELLKTHMQQLGQAGIGLLSVSWWGEGSYEDRVIPLLLDAAEDFDIKVCFHIEPFENRNAMSVAKAAGYIIDNYGNHAAFYRDHRNGDRPLFFVYDSYLIDASEWASILNPDSANTIRGTKYDALVIALWVLPHEERFIIDGGFDGFYTYFAIDEFTFGSTLANWPQLSEWANQNNKIFIPCVGPGYSDTRIRPQNDEYIRDRDHGAYYDRYFEVALRINPPFIGITSFNEWHEGTQIEPAIPQKSGSYMYNDYMPLPPDYYLNRTRYWITQREEYASGSSEAINGIDAFEQETVNHLGRHKKVTFLYSYDPKFDAGGEMGLLDGRIGSASFRDGCWQGFEQIDFSAVVDLEEIRALSEIKINFLQDETFWIFQPSYIELLISQDNAWYESLPIIENDPPEKGQEAFVKPYIFGVAGKDVRYIKILARNIGTCPQWHPGSGGKAWLFVDEIIIQ